MRGSYTTDNCKLFSKTLARKKDPLSRNKLKKHHDKKITTKATCNQQEN